MRGKNRRGRNRRGVKRTVVQVIGFVALAALPVLALNSLATADPSSGAGNGREASTRPSPPQLTDAQKQCLADQGVTLPVKPADGSRPELTQEQRDALRQAREKCGLPTMLRRGHGPGGALTDAQKQCLADQGVTLPVKPADGSRPELTQEQRDAMREAAAACGLPTGPGAMHGIPKGTI
jgi:hypothetical protein